MKKTYLQPTMSGFIIETHTHLLYNSFTDNKIEVDTSNMDTGDGSDGVKADRGWGDIWSE